AYRPTRVCPRKDSPPFRLTKRPALPSEPRQNRLPAQANRSRSRRKSRAHPFSQGTALVQLIQFLIRSPSLSGQTASVHQAPSNARRHRLFFLPKPPPTIVVF